VSFAAITFCVASQRAFIVIYFVMTQSGNFWIHPRILRMKLSLWTCKMTLSILVHQIKLFGYRPYILVTINQIVSLGVQRKSGGHRPKLWAGTASKHFSAQSALAYSCLLLYYLIKLNAVHVPVCTRWIWDCLFFQV
jgi:hypothetical protein